MMQQTILDMGETVTADTIQPSGKQPDLGKLEFSYNWNAKLFCMSYSTLRMHNPGKYYVGRRLGIYLNGKWMHDAEIMEVKTLTLPQINESIARIDTGYSRSKCQEIIQKMYKGKNIDWQTQKMDFIILRQFDWKLPKLVK